jgi:NTP pyrophosphatase (non-canonical NTP hydrolase)
VNRTEHLLWIIAEECAEVAQRVSKAARFTLDERQPGQDLTNEQRIWQEFNDLMAGMMMLGEERGYDGSDRAQIEMKKAKVEKFLAYSRRVGTLT